MMKRLMLMLVVFLGAPIAHGYEYHLQYTPPNGAHNLVVAGYAFSGKEVVGTCSYSTTTVGSGRGSHPVTEQHFNKCTWDLFGNLLSSARETSAASVPRAVARAGYEEVYAQSGASKTGWDARGFGFVQTPSAHYSWETPNGGYADIGDAESTFTVNLLSDGDYPLVIDKAMVQAKVSGTDTNSAGTVKVQRVSCGKWLPVKAGCSVTVAYDPRSIGCTASAYGLAYTTVELWLVTDAGANPDFKRGFTIRGVPVCGD